MDSVVGVAFLDLRGRKLVDLAVLVEHVEQRLAANLRLLGDQLLRPDFLDLEALGELHQLPEIGLGLAGRVDELVPELRAPLGIAVGAFLLHPHRGRQDQVGGQRRHRRIGVRDHDEIVGVAEARIGLLVGVGTGLEVVVDLHPIGVDQAVLQHPALQHGVGAVLVGNGAFRQQPEMLGLVAMRLVGDDHVGRQAVREGADLARGAAGRGLAGQRERAVAGRGDLSGQEMDVVDEVVAPDAAGVLVEAHGPERDHLCLRDRHRARRAPRAGSAARRTSRPPSPACSPRRT